MASNGGWTRHQRKLMQRHSTIGHRILADSGTGILDLAASIALTHHEWYDGRGYPEGLAGDSIPLVGRIAAVADAFDAPDERPRLSARSPHSEAARILREASGSQFDPDVVNAFLDSLELDDVSRSGQC